MTWDTIVPLDGVAASASDGTNFVIDSGGLRLPCRALLGDLLWKFFTGLVGV